MHSGCKQHLPVLHQVSLMRLQCCDCAVSCTHDMHKLVKSTMYLCWVHCRSLFATGQSVKSAEQSAKHVPCCTFTAHSFVQQHCFVKIMSQVSGHTCAPLSSRGEVSSPECRAVITLALFEEASSQQGLLPTGQAVWKEVRGRMAAAAGGRKALADECPASCVGALLAMLLQQVCSTSEHEVCPYCHLLPTDITFLAISCTVAQLHICFSR